MASTKVPIELSSTPGIVDNSNATAITIDSSENVGIGVTPVSAEGSFLQFGSQYSISQRGFGRNTYFDGSNYRAIVTGGATLTVGGDDHIFYTASSVSAGATQAFTERMRITADGTMGFGMSPLGTNNGSAFFDGNVSSKDGFMTTGTNLQLIQPSATNTIFVRDNGNESMRIDSSGCVLVNKTSQTGNAIAGLQIKCGNGSSNAYSFAVRNDTDSQNALLIENSGVFYSDFIYNTTTSDGANLNISSSSVLRRSTSSRRYKTNIRDYDKGINAIQTLSPKYFNGINDGDIQFAGLIAEDVHDAGLTEFVQYNADNEPDSLAYSHMIALLVKAIQEQQTIIDDLKARIETLENN